MQIGLDGVFALHSETAAKNEEIRLDLVAVVEGDRFPRFVENRFAHQDRHEKRKSKRTKKQSPCGILHWFESGERKSDWLDHRPEDLLLRAGFQGEAYLLVMNCTRLGQLEVGHRGGTSSSSAEIRQKVPLAAWLQLKDKERVSDMPVHVEVLPTDKIGYLYNSRERKLKTSFPRNC